MHRSVCPLAALAAAFLILPSSPAPAAIPPYELIGQYSAPSGAGPWDVLPDGRVLFMVGSDLVAADVRAGSPAAPVGTIPAGAISPFGASFVSVSPDGSLIAIGDNNFGPGAGVHLVSAAQLAPGTTTPTIAIASPNQEAVWTAPQILMVSGFGAGPVVTRIDAAAHTARTVITGIGDGTGGVATDGTRLFVGLGFDAAGGASTGHIRAFDLVALESAGPAAPFSAGTLVARALSANSLGFDSAGSLLVGGGDFFSGSGDFGSAAVIDGAGIAAALAGGPIDPVAAHLRLSPAGPGAFYAIRLNHATSELLVSDGATIFRYAVPSPAGLGLLVLASALAARRRRHA